MASTVVIPAPQTQVSFDLVVWEGVEGVQLPVKKGALSVGEGVGNWSSSSICSYSLFMYVSFDFLPCSYLLGYFETFCDVFPCLFEARMEKVNKK